MCHGEGMSRNRYWGLSEILGISCEDHLSPYNWRTMWNIEFVWKHVFTSGHSKIVCFWSSNFCLLLSLVISLTKVTKNCFFGNITLLVCVQTHASFETGCPSCEAQYLFAVEKHQKHFKGEQVISHSCISDNISYCLKPATCSGFSIKS